VYTSLLIYRKHLYDRSISLREEIAGKIPKSNIKIVDRGKIDTLNTNIHDCSLS
jgi:hypothetical protein